MQQAKDQAYPQKYLKASIVAGYRSQTATPANRWVTGWILPFRTASVDLAQKIQFLFAEHFLANLAILAALAGLFVTARERASVRSTVVPPLRFAFHWLSAFLALIVFLPLMGLIAVAVKLDSHGPVFYRQVRVGVNRRRGDRRRQENELVGCTRMDERRKQNQFGKPFRVFKFRTMVHNAEKRCGPVWATVNDPRVTRLGRVLRKTRLDEIPQLINVIRGEMLIVGPRPERLFFIEKLSREIDGYTRRLDVLPGITGLAQIENGYDGSVDDVRSKVRYDLEYIRRSSLGSDLKIMLRTVGVVLGCRGL